MNKKLIFSVLLVVCLLAVVSVVVFSQSSPSPSVRWEYTSFRGDIHNMRATMQKANQLGAEGWELVQWEPQLDDLIFKRRLP